MEKNNNLTKIIIGAIMFLASIGVYFAFDIPKMNEAKDKDDQIKQMGFNIDSRKGYYEDVNNEITALEAAGWTEKRKKIEVNFTSGPFYISKMKYFVNDLVKLAGVSLKGVTYSTTGSAKTQTQAQVTTPETKSTKSTTKIEENQETTTNTPVVSSYFDQMKGPINKTTLNISVSGTYTALNNFLKTIENQSRIGTVQSVKIASSGADTGSGTQGKSSGVNILTAEIVVDFYSY
jgi:hypothetical protein